MANSVQKIILKAKPARNHPNFNEWETASICFLVSENNKKKAIEIVKRKLSEEKWEFLYYELKGTLIYERVKEAGGEVLEGYETALKEGLYFMIFHDNFGPGKKKSQYLCLPKVNEEFIEKVVFDCGGRRLTDEEKAFEQYLNADFIIGNFVFELKDLQEEGLDEPERRQKISNLFSSYYSSYEPIYIDPTILSEIDQKKYLSFLSSPIEKKVKKAFKQTEATNNRLSKNYKLGLIYLNSGYLSLPHDVFSVEVKRYIKKCNLSFDEIITLSVSGQTNGFDLYVNFYFDPKVPTYDETIKLRESWIKNTNDIMTKLVRGELKHLSNPQKPISFNHSGIDFYWLPYAIERFNFGAKS